MYYIFLEDTGSVAFSAAFGVAPGVGYLQTNIFLYILNSTLLDYEVEEWQNFEFQVILLEYIKSVRTV